MDDKLNYGHTPGETLPAHGGSSAVAKPGVTTRHNDGDYVPRRIRWADGLGQDPAQDGAQTNAEPIRIEQRYSLTLDPESKAASVLRGTQPAERASGEESPPPSCSGCDELRQRLDAIEKALGDEYGIWL